MKHKDPQTPQASRSDEGAEGPKTTIPEGILRAADAIVAYPEAYQGFALEIATWLRDQWPALATPAAPQGPQPTQEAEEEYPVFRVDGLRICEGCLLGLGEQCNTPGCALIRARSLGFDVRENMLLHGATITPWAATPSKEEVPKTAYTTFDRAYFTQPKEEVPAVDLDDCERWFSGIGGLPNTQKMGLALIAECRAARLRTQAPASPPRDLEAAAAEITKLRDAAGDGIVGTAKAMAYDKCLEILARLPVHPPEETPIEAAGLTAHDLRIFDMAGWPDGKIVELDPDGRWHNAMSPSVYEVRLKAAPGTSIEKVARGPGLKERIEAERDMRRRYSDALASEFGDNYESVKAQTGFIAGLNWVLSSLDALPQDPASDEISVMQPCTGCPGCRPQPAAGEGEPLPKTVGEPKTALSELGSTLDEVRILAAACIETGGSDVLMSASWVKAMMEAGLRLLDKVVPQAAQPPLSPLGEGSTPSNPHVTQEGAREPKEGGAA